MKTFRMPVGCQLDKKQRREQQRYKNVRLWICGNEIEVNSLTHAKRETQRHATRKESSLSKLPFIITYEVDGQPQRIEGLCGGSFVRAYVTKNLKGSTAKIGGRERLIGERPEMKRIAMMERMTGSKQ